MDPEQATATPIHIPTPQETAEALGELDAKRNSNAAAALELLAQRIIEAVTDVDRTHLVSDYLKSIRVVCQGRGLNGQGVYKLEIEDKNCDTDVSELAQQIANNLSKPPDHAEGRPLRRIQFTIQTGEADGPGTTRPDADAL